MNKPDFDEFAELWQGGDPDPGEQERLEAMARAARRRGRLLAYADYALAVLLIGGSVAAAFVAPGPVPMAAAVMVMLLTVWLTWKRRAYRQMARTLKTGDRFALIESIVRNARADLRRVTLSFAFVPVFVPLALIWKVSLRTGGSVPDPLGVVVAWAQSTRGIIVITLMFLLAAYVVRSRRRIKAELKRLEELRQAYEEEARQEESGED